MINIFMRLIGLVAVMIAVTSNIYSQEVKSYAGNWKKQGTSWNFHFDLGLMIFPDNTVKGVFIWEVLKIDKSGYASYKDKIGKKANEYISGTYNRITNELHLKGFKTRDYYGIISTDEYIIELSDNKITGKTKAHSSSWPGRIKGEMTEPDKVILEELGPYKKEYYASIKITTIEQLKAKYSKEKSSNKEFISFLSGEKNFDDLFFAMKYLKNDTTLSGELAIAQLKLITLSRNIDDCITICESFPEATLFAANYASAHHVQDMAGFHKFLSKFPNHSAIKKYEGGIYFGDLDEAKKRQGWGIFEYNDKSYYIGNWANNVFHGDGEIQTQNLYYKGEFVNGKQHGKGTQRFDGNTYNGQFADGDYSGYGELNDKNGTSYKGNFAQGLENGTGKADYSDNSWYEGEWKNGMWHGHGELRTPDGFRVTGNFVEGKPDGKMSIKKWTLMGAKRYEAEAYFTNGTINGEIHVLRNDFETNYYTGNSLSNIAEEKNSPKSNCDWTLTAQENGRYEYKNEEIGYKVVLWEIVKESALNLETHYKISGTSYIGGLDGRYYHSSGGDVYTNAGTGKKIGVATTLNEAIIMLLKYKYCN